MLLRSFIRVCWCLSLFRFYYFSHAMSYPISGKVKTFMPKHYQVDHPLVVSMQCHTLPLFTKAIKTLVFEEEEFY